MGRKLLEIAYLGTHYCGWQVQPNGTSVQFVLQNALEELLSVRPLVTGCSRTDAGVHATSFFCHFDTDTTIPNEGLVLGLNTKLPLDIAALRCFDVADDFHARYDALGKTYCYHMYADRIRNPFLEGRALRIKLPISLPKAEEYCSLLLGKHDFAAFSSIHRSVDDTLRTVTMCRVQQTKNEICFFVQADGFLYNMVRIMVGGLLDYCAGRIMKENIEQAFITGDRTLLGATAPPQGLFLQEVHYPKEILENKC